VQGHHKQLTQRQKTQIYDNSTSPQLPKIQHSTSGISSYENTTPKVCQQKNRIEIHTLKHQKRTHRCHNPKSILSNVQIERGQQLPKI